MQMLVLGASGFIGGAVARRAIVRGDRVRVLVRSDEDARVWTECGADVHRGDLGDPKSIASAADGVERVVHAAGIADPRAAPRALRWTHVAGTENVVNACGRAKVKRLVFVGCADATLHDGHRVHWDERRALAGLPFGERAKTLALAEEIALAHASPELEVVALRAAWVWGPGDTSRLPSLCREALDQSGLRLIGDGRTFLAAVYIENLVDAIVAALEAEGIGGRIFYVADPEFLHAREIFGAWSEAIGLPPPRSGAPLWMVWPLLRIRGVGPAGLAPEEVLSRARSTLFDVNSAIGKLAFESAVKSEEGLRALSAWVKERGGPQAIAKLAKKPPDDRSVDAQVQAAGGD